MQAVRTRLSEQYQVFQWLILTMLGSALNVLTFYIFLSIVGALQVPFPYWLIPFPILFFIPILLSFLLTKLHPVKRIIAPSHMQFLALAWLFLISADNAWAIIRSNFLQVYVLSLYVLTSYFVQDPVVTSIVGRGAERSEIFTLSLLVKASVSNIEPILSSEPIRRFVGARRPTIGEGIVTYHSRRTRFNIAIQLTPSGNDACYLNLASFQVTRFYIRRTTEVEELSRGLVAYLKDLFDRHTPDPIDWEPASPNHAEGLANAELDSVLGASPLIERLSTWDYVRLVVFGIAIIGSLTLIALHIEVNAAVGTLLFAGVALAFETGELLRRRR